MAAELLFPTSLGSQPHRGLPSSKQQIWKEDAWHIAVGVSGNLVRLEDFNYTLPEKEHS